MVTRLHRVANADFVTSPSTTSASSRPTTNHRWSLGPIDGAACNARAAAVS